MMEKRAVVICEKEKIANQKIEEENAKRKKEERKSKGRRPDGGAERPTE